MNEGTIPDDVLPQYSGLHQARGIYRELFASDQWLLDLGYNKRQIELARPVLQLIEMNPKTERTNPHRVSLNFEPPVRNPDNSEHLRISQIRKKPPTFSLVAETRNNLKPNDFCADLNNPRVYPVFEAEPMTVVEVVLVSSGTISPKNVREIARLLCITTNYVLEPEILLPSSALSDGAVHIGLIHTYNTAWVDSENTQLAVRINDPTLGYTPLSDMVWKILPTQINGFTVIGRMAETSHNTVNLAQRAFEKKKPHSGNKH